MAIFSVDLAWVGEFEYLLEIDFRDCLSLRTEITLHKLGMKAFAESLVGKKMFFWKF